MRAGQKKTIREINDHWFQYVVRPYVHETISDTILDQYVHADDDQGNGLCFPCGFYRKGKLCVVISCAPLYEIYDFEDFRNEYSIQLGFEDGEYEILKTDFDFTSLTYRATADARSLVESIKRCCAANGIETGRLFDRNDLSQL